MEKTVCKRQMTLFQKGLQWIQLNNRWVVDSSETVKNMVGQHASLLGKHGDDFNKWAGDYISFKKIIEKESNLKIHEYNKDMSLLFGKMGRGIKVLDWKGEKVFKGSELIRNPELLKEYIMTGQIKGMKDLTLLRNIEVYGMGFFGKFFTKEGVINEKRVDELIKYIVNTFAAIGNEGYNIDNIFRYLNQGDIVEGVLSEIHQAYKIDLASMVELEDKEFITSFQDVGDEFMNSLKAELSIKGIKPTDDQLKYIIKDLTGEALYKDARLKGLINFNNSLRGVYTTIKYFLAPFTAPLMLAQAFAVGGMNLQIRARGLPIFYRGEAVDYFMDNLKVLKGENPFNKTIFEELGDTWYGTMINKILPNMPKMQAVVKGGWQTIFDMTTDNTVKRLAIANALSKSGWNFKNEKELLEMVKNGQFSKEAYNRVQADALMFYTDFRTNSSSLLLSRNRFSRRYGINALQGYVVNRSSEIFRATYNFAQAVRQGKINTWGDFFKYIEDPANAEFRWMIYAPLLTTKFAFYADKMLNDDEDIESRVEKIKEYALGLNDFISSWDATFMGRIFDNVLSYEGAYIDYVNSKGETGTLYGGVEAGIYGLLGTIMSSLFKEMKTLNIVANPAKMLLDGESDMSILIDQAGIEFNKVAEGMGRFNLLPGVEAYGLKKLPQTDDFFATMLMNLEETNESMKTSSKLRKMEEIEKILSNPLKLADTLNYFNVVKFFMGDEVSKTELKFNRLMKHSTDDEILKNLYNGKFDRNIFNNMVSDDIYDMFKDLTQVDLTSLKLSQKGVQEIVGGAGLGNVKLDTFVELLTQKLGVKNLNTLLDQWEPSAENVGLQKIYALAENELPGSSRTIIAYASNRLKDMYMKKIGVTYDTITREDETEIQKHIIQTMYPDLYIADKTSWYGLIAERAKQIDPTLFGGIRDNKTVYTNKSMKSFVNSLGLMDMVAYSEAQKGNPDAKYISSVYGMIGKYVQDPKQRLGIMSNTYETIERLDIDPKLKATIKLGNALGNIDILDKALKDKNFVAQNRTVVDNAIRTVFGTVDHINKTGMSTLLEDLNDNSGYIATNSKQPNWNGDASKQALSYGQSYRPSQYDNSNREALSKLSSKIPSITKNLPEDYKTGQSIRFPYDVNAKYSQPKPIEYTRYIQIKDEMLGTAQSQHLVSGYVKHSPSDFIDKMKSQVKYNTPKWKTVKTYKVPKGKVLWRRPNLNYD